MSQLSDLEFIQAIRERLFTNGLRKGAMGTSDGPNCLLGAAGYVEHGDDLSTVDGRGAQPVLHGAESHNDYCDVPGMMRLTRLLGYKNPWDVVVLSDKGGAAAVFERLDTLIEELS